jgi:hypothetical protein
MIQVLILCRTIWKRLKSPKQITAYHPENLYHNKLDNFAKNPPPVSKIDLDNIDATLFLFEFAWNFGIESHYFVL